MSAELLRKREQIAATYDSKKWKTKVGKMTDAQVAAIWARLRDQKKV